MKKLIFACLLCMLVCSCNSRQYKVEGNVSGLDDGTIVQLVPMSHDNETPIAEATVNDGKFTFEGQVFPQLKHIENLVTETSLLLAFLLHNKTSRHVSDE